MRHIWVVTCLSIILLASQATAVDQAQKAETAESKAGVLEQNSSAKGSKASPARSEIITDTEAQAVDPIGKEPLDHAITCLSRTIYWEAKDEGTAGMEAIANVIMNRIGHKGFPNTICEVVKQGHEQGLCQFSWWCDVFPPAESKTELVLGIRQDSGDRRAYLLQASRRRGKIGQSSDYFFRGRLCPLFCSL